MGGGGPERDLRDGEELLKLALSRPNEAMAQASRLLASRPGPQLASVAHQAAGIVLRDTGDSGAAVAELRKALRAARLAASPGREADVLASLGTALVHDSRTAAGLTALNQAVAAAPAGLLGRVLHRRAATLYFLGRYPAARADIDRAVSLLDADGDPAWAARARTVRGVVCLQLGLAAQADADFAAAQRLYDQTSQQLEAVQALHNRAWAAWRSGDLPAALSLLDQAAARYRPLSVPTPELSWDRCNILLTAGLAAEAAAEADAALADLNRAGGPARNRAWLLLTAANCALAAGQPAAAHQYARAARQLFARQQRDWWTAHADLSVAQARYAQEPATGRLLAAAARAATWLGQLGSPEATQAHLLAGRIALDLGRGDQAAVHLTAAAGSRTRGPATSQLSGWLSEALRAQAAGDTRHMMTACRRGLAALEQYRLTLGATELRARAAAQGAELAALAQRHAARQDRPRELLAWSERWRATALAVPPARLPAGTGFAADLAALRQAASRVAEARRDGSPVAALERELLRRERVVRAKSLQARGTTPAADAGPGIAGLLAVLGDAQLLEIVGIDGTLQVLLAAAGRVRRFTAGRPEEVARAADFARFALRRLARNRSEPDVASAAVMLDRAGLELERAVLPAAAAAALTDGPVVLVPPGALHGIPWALLPQLRRRAVSVAPSAGAWLRARTLQPPAARRVVLARGPGLVTGGAEVPAVARLHPGATVLSGAQATAGRVLAELDGAWLGHLAAHGTFRADSPLFSALRLHDGPLTVYDFEQLRRAPHRLILSSCDSGVLAPAGGDELLGLVASLLPLGTAGVVASVVPVNDQATVAVMVTLHQQLHAGCTLAEALRRVRAEASADPVWRGTAVSLLAYGAG